MARLRTMKGLVAAATLAFCLIVNAEGRSTRIESEGDLVELSDQQMDGVVAGWTGAYPVKWVGADLDADTKTVDTREDTSLDGTSNTLFVGEVYRGVP